MKKRLFISSILMTLVLLVAITTATFAWYSVQSSNAAIGSTGSGAALNTKKTTGVDLAGLTADFTITWKDGEQDESPVYTAANAKLVDENGAEHVWVNGHLVDAKNDSGNSYAVLRVQISGVTLKHTTGNDAVTPQEKAAAAGTYTLYLAVDGTAKSRVHIFGVTEAPDANGEFDDDFGTQITLLVTLDENGNIVENSNAMVTVYYTFDGSQATADEEHADNSTNGLDITWTLVGTAPTTKNHAN